MMEQSHSQKANWRLIFVGIFFYFVLTAAIGGGVLWLTLWSYAAAGEALSDTTSAAILNTTAATLLWLAFFGGLDMFLTLWTLMQTRQMEADRLRREEDDRREREQERIAREQELAEQRRFQQDIIELLNAEREENRRERQQFLATLQSERERGDLLMTRFLDLAERLGNRNGNGSRSGE